MNKSWSKETSAFLVAVQLYYTIRDHCVSITLTEAHPSMCHKTKPRIQLLSLIFCPFPVQQWPQQVERRPNEVGFQSRARTLLLVSLECAWTSARCRCKGTRASVASSVSLSLIRLALSLSRRAASRFLNRPLVTKVSDNAHCYSYRAKEQT